MVETLRDDAPLQCGRCFTLNAAEAAFCAKCGGPLELRRDTLSLPSADGGAAPSSDSPLASGELFAGRYRIVEEIGRGGMGRVYKAEDTVLNITVALKVIRPELGADPGFVERFKREMLTARSVSHENVIRIHDLGEARGLKFISMDYIRGQSLWELIRSSAPLAPERVLPLARQIGEALRAFHRKGIAHLDLKPANIMIDGDSRVYVLDFGVARALHEHRAAARDRIAGTPSYMSPEQAAGDKPDARSDIYAFGVILYEMYTGRRPFAAAGAGVGPPPLPSSFNPLVSPALDALILRCLEKDKEKRLASLDELCSGLEEAGAVREAARFRRRRRRLAIAGAAGLAGAALAAVLVLPIRFRGRTVSLGVLYLSDSTGEAPDRRLGRVFTELLTQDLAQSKYLRVLKKEKLDDALEALGLQDAAAYSPDEIRRLAARTGSENILTGAIDKAGTRFRVNALLRRASDLETLGADSVEGEGEAGLFAMVEELTRKVKRHFKLSRVDIALDIDRDIRSITTPSLKAYRAYDEGLRLFKERRYTESNQAFARAVESDSGFALAYYQMSVNYQYLNQYDRAEDPLRKALSLVDRVSEKEYCMIQGFADTTVKGTEASYLRLLKRYPDDPDGNEVLGALYRNIEEWDKAEERFAKLAELDPTNYLPALNLAFIAGARGDFSRARDILRSSRHLFPSPEEFAYYMAGTFLCEGRPDLALAELPRDMGQPPNQLLPVMSGLAYQAAGDERAAEALYRADVQKSDLRLRIAARNRLGQLFLAAGRFRESEAEAAAGRLEARQGGHEIGLLEASLLRCRLAWRRAADSDALLAAGEAVESALRTDLDPDLCRSLVFRGLTYVRMGRLTEAQETDERIRKAVDKSGFLKLNRCHLHLRGAIALAENRFDESVADLRAALALLPAEHNPPDDRILCLDTLATALEKRGETAAALEILERLQGLALGRLLWGDVYARSFYRRGILLEKQGDIKAARDAYRKFLELWKGADPGLAEVEDARRRLTATVG